MEPALLKQSCDVRSHVQTSFTLSPDVLTSGGSYCWSVSPQWDHQTLKLSQHQHDPGSTAIHHRPLSWELLKASSNDDGDVVSSKNNDTNHDVDSTVIKLGFSLRKKLGPHFRCLVTPGMISSWTFLVSGTTLISSLVSSYKHSVSHLGIC